MHQIARNTSGPRVRCDRLLSCFEIVRSQEYQQGRPYQQTRLSPFEESAPATRFGAKLTDYRNWNGHWYAEDHIEEWVSRSPQALFPDRTIHVLASQNYAHLPEKIDLLFVDGYHHLHVLELKAEPVASNRGVPPDQIRGQMNRYLEFLQREQLPVAESFTSYYAEFSRRFLGCPHDLMTDLQQTFGEGFPSTSLILCPTFLAEGYDNYAVDYFRTCQQQIDQSFRLIYYRFYVCPIAERHFIEFWEVPQSVPRSVPSSKSVKGSLTIAI
jgi:hypothetical protein